MTPHHHTNPPGTQARTPNPPLGVGRAVREKPDGAVGENPDREKTYKMSGFSPQIREKP
jgi:hypothetical protein